ncbi:MAG: TIGR03087 family PEP-CTERM/XrtA system glycosyltransferase [Pseudomonadota bacterium]
MPNRILFISHRIPYPPNKGDKIRSFNFIHHLAANHEMHLAFIVDNKDDLKDIEPLEKLSQSLFFETISPRIKKATSAINALLASQPISIPYFYSKALQHKIDRFLDTTTVDTVFCFSSPTAEYLYKSKHYNGVLQTIPWIMDLIDVDSHKWRQYADTRSQPLRWLFRREADYLLQYEKQITKEFKHTLLVSEEEKKLLNHYFPASNTEVISNGVDLQHFAPGQGKILQKIGPAIVFTGAMDYWPNIDGVQWFARDIFPQIKKEIADAHFHIVGRKPSSEVRALEKTKGISVTGFVDEVRNHLATADICVIPLRIARGIQNKVLEAMAMGKAVVCSEEAMEGIQAEPGKDLIVAKDAAAFARAVIHFLNDEPHRQDMGRNARICMEKNHSWAKSLVRLDLLLSGQQDMK